MASRDADRPNIVVVLTDDQGAWAMGCAGNGEIRTPQLDRLARTGMRFDHYFCTSPVCSPARATLLTGRIPSQHGVHDWLRAGNSSTDHDRNGRRIEYLRGQPGYTDVLSANGYTCGLSGKWHMGDSHTPQKGISFWRVHARGGGPYYNAPMVHEGQVYHEPRYVTDAITQTALEFLDAHNGNRQPFYLSVHYTAPHSPWERDQHPHDLWDTYYNDCPFASVPDGPLHPRQVQGLITADKANRRELLSGYFAAVTAMDAGVGLILDRLEELGLRENTLVVFTSDNGMNMGHHGVYGKGNGTFPLNMLDTSVKVPFLVSRPGHVPEGAVEYGLFCHYDVMPTLLEYVGLEPPAGAPLPGTSFAPVLRGKAQPSPDSVVVLHEYGPVRMIRTRDWKYVHRYPYGPHELYDLARDPDEETNLYDSPAHTETLEGLKGRLDDWFVRYADPARDGTHEAVTGFGQLGLVGPAGKGEAAFACMPPMLFTEGGESR